MVKIICTGKKNMLFFDEATHTYILEDRVLASVSSVVASQFKGFNSHAVAAGIARRGSTSKYDGMTKEEIVQLWERSGRESRDAGIQLHRDIECFFEHGRLPENPESAEWRQFEAFVNDHPDWHWMASELKVHNNKVAGTIDAVFGTPQGLVLVDWKRCRSISFVGHGNGIDMMKHVPNCNYSKYSLQLSLYKQLLKGNVVECYIIQLHPDLETYQKIRAQDFYMEAIALIG